MNRKREPNSVGVLLRIPVFRRLWSAIAISSLGDWLGLLATTALAAYLTKDSSNLAQGAAVSGVLLTRLLPDLLLAPVAGALVDRFDRRVVAVVGDSLAGLLYVSILISGNLLWLLVAQFLVEAIGLFSTPAKQAMWVNIVPRERLAVANQLNYVSVYGMVPVAAVIFVLLSTVASFFGVPDVAGDGGSALISGSTNTLAINIALGIDALTYFFSAGMVFASRRLIPAFVGDRSTTRNIFSLIVEGVSFVRQNKLMRSIYIGILGAFGAGGLVAGVAQAYVATLGAGNAGYGILFGSVFTGLAFGMLIGPKVFPNVPRRMIFTPAIGFAGISLIVMAVLQDFLGAAITAAVMGIFAGIAWINGFTMIGHEVSDQLRGRVFAFVMSSVRIVLLATIAAGPILAGAIGSYQVTLGDFRFDVTGPAVVLAVGGLIAFGVSLLIGRSIGGLTSGLTRRIFGRRGVNIWDERDDHAGVLIAVEGADPLAVGEYADTVGEHLRSNGWLTVRVKAPQPPVHTEAAPESLAEALRASADLADLTIRRVLPALENGAVVVSEGFIDATIVAHRAVGVEEQRLARVAQWAVNGLKPDLTVLVDGPAKLVADRTSEKATEDRNEAAELEMGGVGGAPGDAVEAAVALGAMEAAEAAMDDATPAADGAVETKAGDPDEELVDPVQGYRDRASYAPERYLIVRPLSEEGGRINPEVAERISSVIRQRTPSLAEPQPTG
ncbi:bifunctional MFS transporter/dTMP kinase [Nakamurella sp. GG22]